MGKAVARMEEVTVRGQKFMVDMSHAKVIDSFKIGDPVKVLKKRYSDEYHSYPGMIIGFDRFENLPTIIIAYFEDSYGNDPKLQIAHLNDQSGKDMEITHMNPAELKLDPQAVVNKMNRDIAEKRAEITAIEDRKRFFLSNFSKVFGIDTADLKDEEDEFDKDKIG